MIPPLTYCTYQKVLERGGEHRQDVETLLWAVSRDFPNNCIKIILDHRVDEQNGTFELKWVGNRG